MELIIQDIPDGPTCNECRFLSEVGSTEFKFCNLFITIIHKLTLRTISSSSKELCKDVKCTSADRKAVERNEQYAADYDSKIIPVHGYD